MERQILHVDVNNAFLSWTATEMVKNGEKIDIRTIPAVIGGDEERRAGIVLAKSTIAKKLGIATGDTLYMARKKCFNLKVYPTNFELYKRYSDSLYQLLLDYTDKIERFSIDECFLDVTQFLQGDTALNKAIEINKRVEKELGFTVNVGVANNKLLAKMASDFEKPNKVHTLYRKEIESKMWNLPISELFMLGKKTIPKLYNMQIRVIGDLAKTDVNRLVKKLGKYGRMIWEYANGLDDAEVNPNTEQPKGIGKSTTLPMDVSDTEELEKVLLDLTEQVTYRLRKNDLLAKTVNVQLRTKDFKDFSHQRKLYGATSSTKEIYALAKILLHEMYKKDIFIRLIGIRVNDLEMKEQIQLSLFNTDKNQENLDKVMDNIKRKYGYDSILRAKNLD